MTQYEVLSIFVSLLAVIVATVSLVRTRKVALQQIELERITAELSKKQLEKLHAEQVARSKAHIDVKLAKCSDTYKFVISNTGGAEATNVNFSLYGEDNPLAADEYAEKIPVKSLKPGKSITLLATITSGSPFQFDTRVHWDNPDGSQEKEEYLVSI